jgi:phasin family protein
MFPVNEQFTNIAKSLFPGTEHYTNAMKGMATNNEFADAGRSNLANQLSLLTEFTTNAFERMEKVMALNLNVAKMSLEDSTAAARQLVSAKDPQEVMALAAAQSQPMLARAIAYSRQLADIAAAAQAEFTRAGEAQVADTGRKLSTLVDEAFKGAPDGSQNAVATVMKSVIQNANAGYEQFNKGTKQVVEAVEANVNKAANQLSEAAGKSAK